MFIILSFYLFSFDLADKSIRTQSNRLSNYAMSRQNPHPGGNMKYTGSQTEY